MGKKTKDHKNILFNQIDTTGKSHFQELIPILSNEDEDIKFLSFGDDVQWSSIKGTKNIIISSLPNGDISLDLSLNVFQGTEMYFKDGQIGIGRLPLHQYKVDISVPVNTRMTALHIGDGVFGFSLGNATDAGFLPQIIGLGSDVDDAGLYFLGKTSSSEGSNTPAIIFDARDINNNALINRPIMGISSGSYSDYKMLMQANGDLEINGNIKAINIIIDSSTGISNLKQELEEIKARLYALENN